VGEGQWVCLLLGTRLPVLCLFLRPCSPHPAPHALHFPHPASICICIRICICVNALVVGLFRRSSPSQWLTSPAPHPVCACVLVPVPVPIPVTFAVTTTKTRALCTAYRVSQDVWGWAGLLANGEEKGSPQDLSIKTYAGMFHSFECTIKAVAYYKCKYLLGAYRFYFKSVLIFMFVFYMFWTEMILILFCLYLSVQ